MTEVKSAWAPSGGQQTKFLTSGVREVLGGGAAGGGKSELLIAHPLYLLAFEHERWLRTGRKSTAWCIHFRRVMPRLLQTINRAHRFYKMVDRGVRYHENTHIFTFTCGLKVQYAHMEKENSYLDYLGQEYCVAKGTRILMADGSYRPIEDVRVGDWVKTLEGPHRVTKTFSSKVKDCVSAEVFDASGRQVGEQVHPSSHPILSPYGWLPFERLQSLHTGHETSSGACGSGTRGASPPASLFVPVVLSGPLAERATWENASSSAGAGSAVGSSYEYTLGAPPLPGSSDLSAPLAPYLRSDDASALTPTGFDSPGRWPGRSFSTSQERPSGTPRGQTHTGGPVQSTLGRSSSTDPHAYAACALTATRTAPGSPPGYRPERGSGGGLALAQLGSDQGFAPSLGGAEGPSRYWSLSDALGSTRRYSRQPYGGYVHPYTSGRRPLSSASAFGACRLTPVGDREVFDLTVETANHYITESGLVNRNCTAYFDELTEFTEEQYLNLKTRVRTSDDELKPFLAIRAASNPIGIGLLWVRKRFVDPWPDGERIIREKVTMPDGEVDWEERMFIPFRLRDNVDGEGKNRLGRDYERTLAGMSKNTRRALLDGDWYITPGAFFGNEWDRDFNVVEPFKIPPGWRRMRCGDYGYNDKAAIGWAAVSPDDDIVVYRTLTIRKHTAEMLAYRIREIEEDAGEWDRQRGCSRLNGPLDPACFARTGHVGPSIAETMIKLGVLWHPADNERVPGWDQMRRRLTARRKSPTLEALGIKNEHGHKLKEFPQLMFFATCKSPIKTIPALPTDEHNAEDADTRADDHDADACRYLCMSRPIAGSKENKPWHEADEVSAMRERRAGSMGYPGSW